MISFILSMTSVGQAFCGTYVGSAGAELYNSASEIVFVRDGQQTTLTMANDYEGELSEFAMLIPVPEVLTEDDVRVVDPAVFDELRQYSEPRLVSYTCEDLYPAPPPEPEPEPESTGCSGGERDEHHDTASYDYSGDDGDGYGVDTVYVEAQFITGEYEIVILSAEESAGLLGWLDAEGYAVSSDASALLQEHIDAGSYFFAARVHAEEIPAGQEQLSPLRITYQSEVPSLPIRLGTVNSAGTQDLILYSISAPSKGRLGIANYDEATVPSACLTDEGDLGAFYESLFAEAVAGEEARWVAEYGWAVDPSAAVKCDPCPEGVSPTMPLSPDALLTLGFIDEESTYGYYGYGWTAMPGYYFTRLHMRYTPEQATQDLTLYHSSLGGNTQQRYIVYEDYLEHEFPVCGEGWVAEPRSCADEGGEYAERMSASEGEAASSGGEAASCATEGASTWRGGGLLGLLLGLTALVARRR